MRTSVDPQVPRPRQSIDPVEVRAARVGTNDDQSSVNVLAELGTLEPQEVAGLLKLRRSPVLDLSRRGILPALKVGKHWRYRRSDLEDWMDSRRDAA